MEGKDRSRIEKVFLGRDDVVSLDGLQTVGNNGRMDGVNC